MIRSPMWAAVGVAAILGLGVSACGSRGAGPGEPVTLGTGCPTPLQWSSTDPRPVGIRIHNEQPVTALVFLDQCRAGVRVGEVLPGATQSFRLTPPFVAYPNGLRFHVYPDASLPGYFMAAIPVDTARVLSLTIPAEGPEPCESRVMLDGQSFAGGLRDIDASSIASMRLEYASEPGIAMGSSCPVIHIRTHRTVVRR